MVAVPNVLLLTDGILKNAHNGWAKKHATYITDTHYWSNSQTVKC